MPVIETFQNLHSSLGIDEMNEAIYELIREQFNSSGFSLFFEDSGSFYFSYSFPKQLKITDKSFSELMPQLREHYATNYCGIMEKDKTWSNDSPPPLACAPLSFNNCAYGLIVLHGESFPEHEVDWLNTLAGNISSEIVRLQLYESACAESESVNRKIEVINDIGDMLKNLSLEVLLSKLMVLCLEIMKAQVGSIVIQGNKGLDTMVEYGLQDHVMKSLKTPDGDNFMEHILAKGEPLLVDDMEFQNVVDVSDLNVHIESLIIIPLTTHTQKLGLINIVNSEGTFNAQDFEILATMSNLAANAVENALLQEQQLESQRLQQEMNLANQIQSSMLPSGSQQFGDFLVHGWSRACDETGGDYYDYIQLDEERVALVVGDVTGHGLAAALLMFIARTSLQTLIRDVDDLSRVFYSLNNRICQDSDDYRFMTMFCGIYNTKKQTLQYISAGHEGPIWHSPSKGFIKETRSTDLPLGVVPDHEFQITEDFQLSPGDTLMFGTDGIWEAANRKNELFGKQRVIDLIQENSGKEAVQISEAIRKAVYSHLGDASQKDDITLLVGKVL